MTRKCVMCKETNYRNTYSFFSAPKDPETRKKWQNAISIENYAVTDDTYVCSKHFHKDDIITHWVSGVPPHVITIKYKKCRLRPGAVPNRNYHLEEDILTISQEHSDDSDINIGNYLPFKLRKTDTFEEKEKDFLIPRTEEKLQINYDENHRIMSLHHQFSHEFDDYNYVPNRNSLNKMELSENGSNTSNASHEESKVKESLDRNLKHTKRNNMMYQKEDSVTSNTDLIEDMNSEDKRDKQNQVCEVDSYTNVSRKISESSCKIFNVSEGDDIPVQPWGEHETIKEDASSKKPTENNLKKTESLYIENQIINNLNYDQLHAYYSAYNDIEESEMLFEDLLEICTEVLLPRGWSCLVTSKGHTTTIVYLYMGMTKAGMPFMEKQVFVKSDMILRCAAVNREINPLIHNLIREGKHLKVQNLLDIEELIDEFDQRTVCHGIYNTEGFQEVTDIKVAYTDGIKWRHVLCPLIVNNDSLRCTRCITLSHKLQRRLRNSHSFCYKFPIFTKKEQQVYTIRQKYKRIRKHNRRYEFIKVFKK